MQNDQQSGSADTNLLWAVVLLTLAAGASALGSAWICDSVLSAFASSKTMALIIVDGGRELKSDDAQLERQLSTATLALQTVRDFGWALAIGSFSVLVAVLVRVFYRPRSQNAS